MAVRAVGQQTQKPATQENIQNPGRYSTLIPRIASNLNKLIIPIIGLFAMASLPKADGGPLSYSACCLACTASAPPAFPACIALCAVVIFFPSP